MSFWGNSNRKSKDLMISYALERETKLENTRSEVKSRLSQNDKDNAIHGIRREPELG